MNAIFKDDNNYEKISELLEKEYIDIFNSINDEGYKLQYENFDVFVEIEDSDNVVGFYSLEQLDSSIFALNECYIQKEFRGKNLMGQLLEESILLEGDDLYIRNPNYNMIKVLLNNNLAIKIEKNIIVSFFNLIASSDDIYRSPRIKGLYRRFDEDEMFKSIYYDNKLKTMLAMDSSADGEELPLIVVEPRKMDVKRYNFRKKFRSFSSTKYILNRMSDIYNIDDNIIDDFIDGTFDRLMDSVPVEDMIIDDDAVDDSMLEEYNLSKEDFLRIREHIIKSVENGDVKREDMNIRYNYILRNPEMIGSNLNLDLLPFNCPFCESVFYPFFNKCPICGLYMDFDKFWHLLEHEFLGDNEIIYTELMDKIKENDWDYDEILELQSLFGTFEFIEYVINSNGFDMEIVDRINKLKSGTVADYAIKNGYVKECSYEEFINIIKDWDAETLVDKFSFFDFTVEDIENDIKNNIEEFVSPDMQFIDYIPTEKGIKFWENSEDMRFFFSYLVAFSYCEFKKYLDEHDCSLVEAGNNFIEEECQKAVKNNDFSVYKKKWKYETLQSDDIDRRIILAIKLLIYDVNIGNEMSLSYTDMFIFSHSSIFEVDQDKLDYLFNCAFDEFEISELKNNKEEVYDKLISIYHSGNILFDSD